MSANEHQHSGIYLLPNLFTTASLFAAFYAIVSSMNGHFENAVISIFIGMICDGLDGRIARLTNTQTEFGAQYDSMSDMVTFGVAPALLIYSSKLYQLGKIGWLIAFCYTASVALRLARFNTQLETQDKRFFQGLSCPTGAAVIISFIWLSAQMNWTSHFFVILTALLAAILAGLMVSNLRYYSFKDIDFKGKVPFLYILLMVVLFVAIASWPPLVLFIGFGIYASSGPIHTIWQHRKIKQNREESQQ